YFFLMVFKPSLAKLLVFSRSISRRLCIAIPIMAGLPSAPWRCTNATHRSVDKVGFTVTLRGRPQDRATSHSYWQINGLAGPWGAAEGGPAPVGPRRCGGQATAREHFCHMGDRCTARRDLATGFPEDEACSPDFF